MSNTYKMDGGIDWRKLPVFSGFLGPYDELWVVTDGPLAGRVCKNDEHHFLTRSEMEEWELLEYIEAGVDVFRIPEEIAADDPVLWENEDPSWQWGVPVAIVSTRANLLGGTFDVPIKWLRKATVQDLLDRQDFIFHRVYSLEKKLKKTKADLLEIIDLLHERELTMIGLEGKMSGARAVLNDAKDIFLCHASDDKGQVRKIYDDLIDAGAKPWMDEFEIFPGQSIVAAIDKAQAEARAVILFWSSSAMKSAWVKKEWNSALSRFLAGSGPVIIPVLLDPVDVPPLLHDILHVRLFENYNDGFDKIVCGLNKIPEQ